MIRVAIVEDEQSDFEKLAQYFDRFSRENDISLSFVRFVNGDLFLKNYQIGSFDLVMMDIELTGSVDGMTTSKKLREIDPEVTLVFMTNLAQYALEGYQVSAMDYIVKPIEYFDFQSRMKSIFQRIEKTTKDKVIILSDGNKIVLKTREIYYVEVNNHELVYHTSKGNFTCRGSLKTIKDEMDSSAFSLCNNCYLVNLDHVEKVMGFSVLVHGDELQISHPRKKQFLQDLSSYLGE